MATLKRDQAGYTFPTEYVDKISDAALTGTPSFNLVAVEQAMPGTPGDMTLKASPGVPRKVNVTVMNRTEDADYMHMHEAVYTVTGTLADGTSTTDTLRFDVVANKQMPAVPGALSISRQPSVPTTLHCAVYNSTSGELPNDQVHFLVSGRLSDDTESTEDIVIGMNAGILSHANAYSNGSKVWKQIDSITVDVTQAAGLQYWVSEHLALNGEVRIQGVKEFVTVTEIAFDAVQNTGWAHKAGIGSGEAEPYSYVNRQPAPAVRAIRTYNDRLWGINSHYGGYLAFSSLAQPEYWPLLEAVPTDTGKLVDGGAVQIGSAGDCITGFVPEVGAYSSQGRTGSALLVFTTRGATRIFGRDWTDFKVDAAYPVGCIAGRSIVNARGVIIWRSRDGIMTCPAGGSQPVCVSDVIPEFFAPSLAQSGVAAGGHITSSPVDNDASDVAVFWQGIYIIACGGDGNPYAMVYSPGSGWFGLSYLTDATGFHVTESAKGYGDLLWCTDDGLFRMSCGVLGGDHTTDGDATGNGATGEAWKLLLGPVGNLKDNSLVGRLTVKRVLFLVENGDSAAEVKLILYPMGSDWNLSLEDPHPLVNSDTGATTATKTIAAAPTGKRALRAVEWYPNSVCRYPAVGLSGSSAVDFSIKAVQIDLAAVGSDDIA